MRVGFTDAGNSSEAFHTRRAYDLLSKGFGPGFNAPLAIALVAKTREG
jgi:RND superfamily putative drug exporter